MTYLACFFLLAGMAGAMTGCGGGFGVPNTTPTSNIYALTVNGTSGSLQHGTTVQLTVTSVTTVR
jgi:hypothetical protein